MALGNLKSSMQPLAYEDDDMPLPGPVSPRLSRHPKLYGSSESAKLPSILVLHVLIQGTFCLVASFFVLNSGMVFSLID